MTTKIAIHEAKTFTARLLGFMFKTEINSALLFNNCNSIHTFFMKEKIDVVMTDSNNTIIYIWRNMPKNRVILPKKNVTKTYEFPAGFIKDNIKVNDQLKI